MGKTALPTLWPPRWGWGWSSLSATFPDPGPCRALVEKGRAAPHLSLDLWEVPPLVRLDINSTRTSQGKQTSAEVDKRTSIFHPPPWTCPGAWGCCFSSWGSPLPRLSRCESELRGPGRWHDSLHLTPVHCFPHLNPPIPLYMFTGRYILVTPRVLRIGSPETIHVEAHSDSSEPLSHPLEVNLSVWDFPMKNTRVARRELVLSKENHFMDQASVTVGDRPR